METKTIPVGDKFQVVNYHKPLQPHYNKTKLGHMRVERHKLELQGFNFELIWEQGASNPVDCTSRHPVPLESQKKTLTKQGLDDDDEVVVNRVLQDNMSGAVGEETDKDPVLSTMGVLVQEYCNTCTQCQGQPI